MSANDERVMVTGGAGMIGSHLVERLVTDPEWRHCQEVIIVDNLVNGRRANVEEFLGDRARLVVADIRDNETMADLMQGIDVVFHLACLGVRHSIHSPHENHEVNATATLKLLSLARERKVGRFVYISSSEVYGTARCAPMTEEHPTFPMTIYGASKLAGDCYTRAFWETYRYPTVVVRPFNAYGPRCHHEGDSGEVIPKFMLRCLAGRPMVVFGDGTQTRDFAYVSDTARGILLTGWADRVVGKTINLGSDTETSINDLARHIASVVGRADAEVVHDRPRPGDVWRLCADSTRARELIGFAPRVGLEDGLKRLRDWYAESGRDVEALLAEEVVHNWEAAGAKSHA